MTKKKSVADKILELGDFLKTPRSAEEIKKELKDRLGHNIPLSDISVNLLRLLRKGKIQRKKDVNNYKYFL